jgi:hypothetical protein
MGIDFTPCGNGESCIEHRPVGDQVEIRNSDNPDATLLVPAAAWEQFLASVRAGVGVGDALDRVRAQDFSVEYDDPEAEPRTYADAIADLRAEANRRRLGPVPVPRSVYTEAADFLQAQIQEGERD